MESLKLVFLFSLTVFAFCSSLGEAREMAKEEVNCIGGKCPEGEKHCNCLPPVAVAPTMAKEEVNCIGGKCPKGEKDCNCSPPVAVAPTMDVYETNASCRRDNECIKYCPKGCKIVNCNFGTCFCEC